jgi:hypothetical protein
MNDAKYIGLDVHQATISVAILDSAGKLVMEAILETKSATILHADHINAALTELHVAHSEIERLQKVQLESHRRPASEKAVAFLGRAEEQLQAAFEVLEKHFPAR